MTDQVALVTGVSKGIGHAIATVLLQNGYVVHGTFNSDREGAKSLSQEFPGRIEVHQVNFSRRAETQRLCADLADLKLDALVNNAGIVLFEDFDSFDFG